MKRCLWVVAGTLCVLCACGSKAVPAAFPSSDGPPRVVRVPADQPTVQAGVDAACSGDLVLVAPGTYREAVVVRTPRVVEANRTDLAYYLGTVKAAPADKANCFAEHRFATSSPAGIETALPCASKANTNRPGTVPTLIRGASSLGYRKVRLPPPQPDMADALTAPPRPAVDGPPTVEVAKLQVPG